jgi:hypothetical protein
MESYTSRQMRASNARRADQIIAEWDDAAKPALERIEKAAMGLLHALYMARTGLMAASDIKALDAFGCDVGGQTIDLLHQLTATQRREIDDCDGDPDALHLDLGGLEEEHKIWEARWNARKPT